MFALVKLLLVVPVLLNGCVMAALGTVRLLLVVVVLLNSCVMGATLGHDVAGNVSLLLEAAFNNSLVDTCNPITFWTDLETSSAISSRSILACVEIFAAIAVIASTMTAMICMRSTVF